MAVQKSRVTRSRRGMRRSHDKASHPTLAVDQATGEIHMRHHVTPTGNYKGRQVIAQPINLDTEEENNEE